MKRFFIILCAFSASVFAKEDIYRFGVQRDGQPKIAIATVVIGEAYQKKMEFCTKSKINYCKKQGYDFIVAHNCINECFGIKTECLRNPSWHNISLVSKYLEEYDWIFFLDADTLIMNYDVRVEQFLDDDCDFIGAANYCFRDATIITHKRAMINGGSWFIKNSEPAKQFLAHVWVTGDNPIQCCKNGMEQKMMQYALCAIGRGRLDIPLKWKTYSSHFFNTQPRDYVEGDFLVHFYGLHKGHEIQSIKCMKKIHDRLNPPE